MFKIRSLLISLTGPWRQITVFWLGAALVALVAIGAARACLMANDLFIAATNGKAWLPFVLTPLGFALVMALTRRFFSGAEGSGVPQTIAAMTLFGQPSGKSFSAQMLSLKTAFGKIVLTVLGICAGASVGHEGPSVQIGAALMHNFGKDLPIRIQNKERALVLAGGAAGIAAAFNTPLAGVLFAIEDLAHTFEEKTNNLVLTCVIFAGVCSLALLGNYSYFGHTNVALDLSDAMEACLLCGIAGGVCGGFFSRALIFSTQNRARLLPAFFRARPVLFAALCGLALAGIGFYAHNCVFGTGYAQARALLEGKTPLPLCFGVLKLLSIFLSCLSGIPGGLFAPALAAGAGIGADVAVFLPHIPSAALIILGMVATFSGVVQAPLTAAVIVMEMTSDSSLTLPLMISAFLAFGVSRLICPTPLYKALSQGFVDQETPAS